MLLSLIISILWKLLIIFMTNCPVISSITSSPDWYTHSITTKQNSDYFNFEYDLYGCVSIFCEEAHFFNYFFIFSYTPDVYYISVIFIRRSKLSSYTWKLEEGQGLLQSDFRWALMACKSDDDIWRLNNELDILSMANMCSWL